jgi:predicted nucleic acid-binding protein
VRTALDTNVISAIWSAELAARAVSEALEAASAEGGLVIAAPVYAELLAYPRMTTQDLDQFLGGGSVDVDFDLSPQVWRESGERFSRYASRRRRSNAGQPQRLFADFIIGAHALLQADRLMTLDANRYRREFPELRLITIAA